MYWILARKQIYDTLKKHKFPVKKETLEELGRGGVSIVFRGIRTDTQVPFMAKLAQKKDFLDDLQESFTIFKEAQLNHPNISQLNEMYVHRGFALTLGEYIKGADLEELWYSGASERQILQDFEQGLTALLHMHKQGVIHRDAKLENFLRESETGLVKVIDYDAIHRLKNGRAKIERTDYTPHISAPEVLLDSEFETPLVDSYAFATSAMKVFSGETVHPLLCPNDLTLLEVKDEDIYEKIARDPDASHRDLIISDFPEHIKYNEVMRETAHILIDMTRFKENNRICAHQARKRVRELLPYASPESLNFEDIYVRNKQLYTQFS